MKAMILKYYPLAHKQSVEDGWGLLYNAIVLNKKKELIPYITAKNHSIADHISLIELMRKENDEFGVMVCAVWTEIDLYLGSHEHQFDIPKEIIENLDKSFLFEYMVYPRDTDDYEI